MVADWLTEHGDCLAIELSSSMFQAPAGSVNGTGAGSALNSASRRTSMPPSTPRQWRISLFQSSTVIACPSGRSQPTAGVVLSCAFSASQRLTRKC